MTNSEMSTEMPAEGRLRACNSLLVVPFLALALVAIGCTRTKPKSSTELESSDKTASESTSDGVCSRLAERAVSVVMGGSFKVQKRESAQACSFVDSGNPELVVSVNSQAVPNGDSFAALVSSQGVTRIDSDVHDEVFMTPTMDQLGHRAVVRRGGQAAVIGVRGVADEEELKAYLIDLARAFSSRLPDNHFDSDVTTPTVACETVDTGSLAAKLGVTSESLKVTQLPGETGCAISSSDSPVGGSARVELGEASVEELKNRGGSVKIDGKTFNFTSRDVDGVGTQAVWQAQNPDGTAGELLAIISGRLVRVSATGGASEEELINWASAVAQVLAPVLIG